MDAIRRSSAKQIHPSSPPSHPLSGLITRSKYHFLRHRNRTGHLLPSDLGRRIGDNGFQSSSASDSVKYSSDDDDEDMLLISEIRKKAKLNQESSVGDDGEPSRILIKDLRARRVYSQPSVGGSFSSSNHNAHPKESRVGSSCGDQNMVDSGLGSASTMDSCGRTGEVSKRAGEIDNLGKGLPSEGLSKDEINSILCSIVKEYQSEKDGLNSDDALDTMNEETENPLVASPYKAQNLDHANYESVGKAKGLQCFNDSNDGRGSFKRVGSSNEVPKLTTPPDIEMCGNVEVDEDERNQVHGIHVKDKHLTGNGKEPFCPKADDKIDSVLKSKSVLRPRMQRKLFKTPGSVSYRRLLPFIMNMTKDDSGTSTLGDCQNDEKVIDAKQLQFPSSSQKQEASKDQPKTDSCPPNDTVESGVLADKSDLSGGSESKLTSYRDLPELPMQLSAKAEAHDCSFVPSVNEHIKNVEISLECSSNTKADLAVDFLCDMDATNIKHNDDFRQDSEHNNVHGGKAKANDGGDTSEKICVLNQECSSPPDADMCGEDKNTPGRTHHVNSTDLTRSALVDAAVDSCPKATKGKDSVLKSKSVLKPCLQRKLFKTPGSVSYRRLLPFLKDIAEDDCGAPSLGDKKGMFAKRSEYPLLFQSPEATIDEIKTDSCPMHGIVDESNAIEDTKSIDPANEISYGRQPIEMSSQDLPEFPMRLNAKEVVQECVSAPSVKRDGPEPKTTLVFSPRLQIEFLKHSGSFSYRRLLPFLKNIKKDNSCAIASDHEPKLEKCLDQTTHPPNSALDDQVTPMNDPIGCVVPMEHCTGNSATEQKVLPGPDDSLNHSSPKAISSARVRESQSSHDSCNPIQQQDERVESSPDSSISVARIDSSILPSSPTVNGVIREDATSASHRSSVSSEAKGNSSSNGEMPLNTDGCCQSFQTKALEQHTNPTVGFRKGILKRNPRGCRGLCTCLNCASFRLHAERAFEFSRNQLLDAEEVALDLIEELSHLRNMLERRIDGANNLSVLDENQVKEACRKAYEAEQLAKDRLSQMNDDLNIHCRITCSQQPRVRFANYIEERLISPGRLFRQK